MCSFYLYTSLRLLLLLLQVKSSFFFSSSGSGLRVWRRGWWIQCLRQSVEKRRQHSKCYLPAKQECRPRRVWRWFGKTGFNKQVKSQCIAAQTPLILSITLWISWKCGCKDMGVILNILGRNAIKTNRIMSEHFNIWAILLVCLWAFEC